MADPIDTDAIRSKWKWFGGKVTDTAIGRDLFDALCEVDRLRAVVSAADDVQGERPLSHWEVEQVNPPWVGDSTAPTPDVNAYMESELFVAGAISTLPPFSAYHPAWALPIARQALDALSEWEPNS